MSFCLLKRVFFAISLAAGIGASAAPVNFIAFGDTPYFGDPGHSMFKKLIANVNAEHPDFVVHVGDIRGGVDKGCTDANFLRVLAEFKTIDAPFFYTPGDNDWTDCHRHGDGGFDPLERLSFIRRHFFGDALSHGNYSVVSQSHEAAYSDYVENLLWSSGSVQFGTFHIVGSNNNRNDQDTRASQEYRARNAANLSWLKEVFKTAKREKRNVIVMFFQADMRFYVDPKDDSRKGYNDFIDALTAEVLDFSGQVLAVNGDSHTLIIDKPLINNDWVVPNFTRLQVFGAPDVGAVRVTVDAAKSQPFVFEALPLIPWEY